MTGRNRSRAVSLLAAVALLAGLLAAAAPAHADARLIPVTSAATSTDDSLAADLPQPERVLIQKSDADPAHGNVLVTLELSPEATQSKSEDFINLGTEETPLLLRDDGNGLDPVAGDGRFTGIAFIDDAELTERNQDDLDAAAAQDDGEQFVFAGRGPVGTEPVEPFDVDGFLAGRQVELRQAAVVLDDEIGAFSEPVEGETSQPAAASGVTKSVASLTLPSPTPSPGVTNLFQDRVLMIRDPRVVQDSNRTWDWCTGGNPNGVWTFNHLMTEMANQPLTGIDPSVFVEQWLQTWVQNPGPTINSFTVSTRQQMQVIIDRWRADSGGGKLDLSKAPLRLLSIVPRLDLRRTTGSTGGYGGNVSGNFLDGGEARFVFGFIVPKHWGSSGGSYEQPDELGFVDAQPIGNTGCQALPFTVIFEYRIPKCDCFEVRDWARQWVELRNHTPGTSAYNGRLQRITDQFVSRNSDPTSPNGSALGQLRTNEVALPQDAPTPDVVWELREFQLTQMPFSFLQETTTADTAHDSFNQVSPQFSGSPLFHDWVLNNIRPALVTGGVEGAVPPVPLFFQGSGSSPTNFLGANPQVPEANPNVITYHWNHGALNLADTLTNWARHRASRNACSGCHRAETLTDFVHVDPNDPNTASTIPVPISGFLSGINNVPDPAHGTPDRHFDDLLRRESDIRRLARIRCARFHPADKELVKQSLRDFGRLPDDLFGPQPPTPPDRLPALALDDVRRNAIQAVH